MSYEMTTIAALKDLEGAGNLTHEQASVICAAHRELESVLLRLDKALEYIRGVADDTYGELVDWQRAERLLKEIDVERRVTICCHIPCGKPVEQPGKLFCAHHAYEHPTGFELPSE